MCGICGIINIYKRPVDPAILKSMTNALSHRGPDGEGSKVFENIGLGHRRLSIIDISRGGQPLSNETGEIWITFNGEIYNYKELKRDLLKKGHVFKTDSDTEVIVHLYEEYESSCVNKLEGMFAFAIYDKRKHVLFLARDRMGKKPLFYCKDSNLFTFASELQSIVKHPEVKREINNQAIHDYLSLNYIPAPSTIYRNIYKLKPAHSLELKTDTGDIFIKKYWQCQFEPKINISYNDAQYQLKYLLKEAVSKRLMSEVPLGAFLSGGADSSIITSIVSEIVGRGNLSTFTIGFNDKDFDERAYAEISAKHFGTQHHVKTVHPADFSIAEDIIDNFGEPFADASMIPTFQVSKFAREKITVAISGDGGDEIFSGYYRYLLCRYALMTDFIPLKFKMPIINAVKSCFASNAGDERKLSGKLKRICTLITTPESKRYLNIIDRCGENLKRTIYGEALLSQSFTPTLNFMEEIGRILTASNRTEKLMETDMLSYLPCDILTKVDIASMANSLEIRSPFLDHKLVEFSASLPLRFKQTLFSRKRILKDTFAEDLPKEILKRKKMGFGVPVGRWLRNEWKEQCRDLLLDSYAVKNGFFNAERISELIEEHNSYKSDQSYTLWALMIFELWYRQFML
jgi:asparagine synthase (glutamine-hydrolysing)